jgi:catechol 2,3-dioxygenase-like lactoylglutathione lyase family enzyme
MAKPPGLILETAIYGPDLAAMRRFYGGIIGLEEIAFAPPRNLFFRCGGSVLLIFNPAETAKPATAGLAVPAHGATGPGHLCFAASRDEQAAWRRRLAEAGIAVERTVLWPNGAQSTYVRDPAGNSLEFAEPRLWE